MNARWVLLGMCVTACGGKARSGGADLVPEARSPVDAAEIRPDACAPRCESFLPYCGMDDGCWYSCGCPEGHECLQELTDEPDFCEDTDCHGVGICFSYELDCPEVCGDAECGTVYPGLARTEGGCDCGTCPPGAPLCWTDGGCHADVEPGALGTPCDSHEDCFSGWCVTVFDGIALCAGGDCMDGCPDGWACRCDPAWCETWHCVPYDVYLCMPCLASIDCGLVGLCIDSDTLGRVCVEDCGEDADCPAGTECADGTTVEGQAGGFCVPEGGAPCTCSPAAAQADVEGSCTVENEFGSCSGTRSCLPDGTISGCDAPVPQAEACDGQDDDCDGETDEGC